MEGDSGKGGKSRADLTRQEEILLLLSDGSISQAEIGETLHVRPTQVSREVTDLEKNGFARRYEVGTPPRRMVEATERGLDICPYLRKIRDARKRIDLVQQPPFRDEHLSKEQKRHLKSLSDSIATGDEVMAMDALLALSSFINALKRAGVTKYYQESTFLNSMNSKVNQELPPKVMARLLTLLTSIVKDMLDDDKFCEQMNVIAPRLVELTIDEGRTDEVRQNAINLLRVLRKRDGTIPDGIVEDMLKIIWNYAGSGYLAFDIQGAVLFEIIIEWHPILTGEQWSIIAASTSGLEAGSEQDFLGHLKGRAPYRKVRAIDVARVSAYRRRIEAINILK